MIERILEDKRSVLDLDCSCPKISELGRIKNVSGRPELKTYLRRPEVRFSSEVFRYEYGNSALWSETFIQRNSFVTLVTYRCIK